MQAPVANGTSCGANAMCVSGVCIVSPPDAGMDSGTDGATDAPADSCAPLAETCNGHDDDCDGVVDDGIADGATCDGPDGDSCREGVLRCMSGSMQCTDVSVTNVELCNGTDDDCDGTNNEGFTGLGTPCDGTDGDLCSEGTRVCNPAGNAVICNDVSLTNAELCTTTADDDCDGTANEGCPTCTPFAETCNGADDDCDALVDEGGVCECSPDLLVAPGLANDAYGTGVAISGDVAVVGAKLHDARGTNSGIAFVFRWSGTAWALEQTLLPTDVIAYDAFGSAVAIDGNTLAVVAPGRYVGGVQTGMTYVYRHNGTSWTVEQQLSVGESSTPDAIYPSVSISGNVMVLGKADDSAAAYHAGSASVYVRSGSTWTLTPKLVASDAASADFFGLAVAAFGDWVVAGAYNDDDRGNASGSAYLFRRNNNGTALNVADDFWQQTQKVVPADGAAYNAFGRSVALDHDVLVVGAYMDGTSGLAFGSAYVYRFNGSTWAYEDEVFGSGSITNGLFGASVAVFDDVMIVGAPSEKPYWTNGGAAYLFRRNGSTWSETARLEDPTAYANNNFGASVALFGDLAIVGAPRGDSGRGAALAFDLTGCP